MIFKSELRSGSSDVSDLKRDPLIQWQHRHYFILMIIFGLILPAIVPGLLFDDWLGGICFSFALRLTVAHHVRFYCFLSFYFVISNHSLKLDPDRVRSVSTRLPIGSATHPMMTFYPLVTISFPQSLRWAKATTISTTSSLWTIETPFSGTSMIPQNGSSHSAVSLAWRTT